MSYTSRRCVACGLPIKPDTPSCPRCGATDLVMGSEPPVDDPVAEEQRVQAAHPLFVVEPLVQCIYCFRRIEAAQAYHSRYGGLAVCWPCKQAENG